jgi:hypothetical protein
VRAAEDAAIAAREAVGLSASDTGAKVELPPLEELEAEGAVEKLEVGAAATEGKVATSESRSQAETGGDREGDDCISFRCVRLSGAASIAAGVAAIAVVAVVLLKRSRLGGSTAATASTNNAADEGAVAITMRERSCLDPMESGTLRPVHV